MNETDTLMLEVSKVGNTVLYYERSKAMYVESVESGVCGFYATVYKE